MENQNFIEKLAAQFGQSASVKNVFGDPIQAGDKTIIPVAQIAYGVGGGFGQGSKKYKSKTPADPVDVSLQDAERPVGEGAGGGGGMYAKPKGVYEVTATCTRFIPANNGRQILLVIAIGWLIKGWLFSKRNKVKFNNTKLCLK